MTEEKMRQQLEQKLCKLEAQEACRNLMGRYSYYRTAFQNKEMVELWAKRDDAKLVTPWGSYQGHSGIEACYLKDIGDRSDAKVFEAINCLLYTSLVLGCLQTIFGTAALIYASNEPKSVLA